MAEPCFLSVALGHKKRRDVPWRVSTFFLVLLRKKYEIFNVVKSYIINFKTVQKSFL